ncbi:uncharacterized protein LOC143678310 [Tamandua tetradactyla]|uniref:uncharacterized protein LOC143678310 n=1 Tax=Tamandua tetradactyla TaxID=48850 RepID=UPI00405446BF
MTVRGWGHGLLAVIRPIPGPQSDPESGQWPGAVRVRKKLRRGNYFSRLYVKMNLDLTASCQGVECSTEALGPAFQGLSRRRWGERLEMGTPLTAAPGGQPEWKHPHVHEGRKEEQRALLTMEKDSADKRGWTLRTSGGRHTPDTRR